MPDEHSHITFLFYLNLEHEVIKTFNTTDSTTIVDWSRVGSDNRLPYTYTNVSIDEIKNLHKSKSFFARKFDKTCNLKYLEKLIS